MRDRRNPRFLSLCIKVEMRHIQGRIGININDMQAMRRPQGTGPAMSWPKGKLRASQAARRRRPAWPVEEVWLA